MTDQYFLAVETGGTKIVARIETGSGVITDTMRAPTTTPDEIRDVVIGFVRKSLPNGARLAGAGMAAFGPLVLDSASSDFGRLLATTKPGWSGANLRRMLSDALGVEMAVDTDVNAAALAEQRLGAGRGRRSIAYVTVGTGIGGGLAIDGRTLHGFPHPEIGHLRVARSAEDQGISHCPFHDDCAEGLAAGPSVMARLGPGRVLADDPALVDTIAGYLGQLAASLVLAWAPERIVWGGGVMSTPGMVGAIEQSMRNSLAGYDTGWKSAEAGFCVSAMLEDAGLEGAMLMARGAA